MFRIAFLCLMLSSGESLEAEAQSPPQSNLSAEIEGRQTAESESANVIHDPTMLRVGTNNFPVAYRVTGRLIWRNRRGALRLQFENTSKAFRLKHPSPELQKCNLGDLVEVSGNDITTPSMNAQTIRLIERWDGARLSCQPAFTEGKGAFWRYVEYTDVVREVLQKGPFCRLHVGNRVIVATEAPMTDEQLKSLLGCRVRVSGVSFIDASQGESRSPTLMYIGILDPDVQIKLVSEQPSELSVPGNRLTLANQTVDFVSQRYIAIGGHGISSAMSHHLQQGDLATVDAWDLDPDNRTATSIWLKITGSSEPSQPETISGEKVPDQKLLHHLVSVRGTVQHCFATERSIELTLSDRNRTYVVNMPFPDERRQVDQYARGALVSVSGVVRSISSEPGGAINLGLDVARSSDLIVAETPMQLRSWLVKSVLAAVVVTGLLLAVWYWALKRQVRRKTAQLSTSTNRMIAASSAVRDGLLIFDADSRVSFVSDKVYSTLGVSIPVGTSECSSRLCLEKLVCETDSFTDHWNAVFRNPLNTFESEFSLRESGRRVFAYSAPVYGEAGQPDGRIWTFEDITQRRKLEDETLRTRKLGAIGRLAGGVAHDFNNLLQVIGSNLELMQHSKVIDWPESKESPLGIATTAIKRGADLTHQLLTFAKTSRVNIAPTDVNQLLEETSRMLDRAIGDHIRLSVSLATDLPVAEIDPGQLQQVVINMCLNSAEAIGLNDGFIRIATRVAEHKQIGSSVLIRIDDDGCGMSPEVLSHVFEPFFTTKQIDKGTGLGLSTAFGAIEQMNGRIECSSAHGQGTSFKIYLPASEGIVCVPAPVSSAQINNSTPRRILVVDDDARVLGSVNQLLMSMGHEVICAGGGAEAMSTLKDESVDLVILDLSMPEMTGWEVLQQIREKHSQLKVIVCSGYTDDVAEMVASDIEPDAFLNKPFQLQQLSSALESVSG